MGSVQYLAMFQGQIPRNLPENAHIAVMGMHLSPGGSLMDVPDTLPGGSLLLFDDRFPPPRQAISRITEDLQRVVEKCRPQWLYLDFQRPDVPENHLLAQAACAALPGCTAVSHLYAEMLSCPVVLPPIPNYMTPEEHFAPWAGREIWLEQALSACRIHITPSGSVIGDAEHMTENSGFFCPSLSCRYTVSVCPDGADFTLWHTPDTLRAQADAVAALGIKICLSPCNTA